MVAEDGFWVSKLQDAAILDIFATMFAMSDSKVSTETLEPEEDLVKTLDDVAETFTTAEVTSAWNQGGIPVHMLAAAWGMGGKNVRKKRQAKPVTLAPCAFSHLVCWNPPRAAVACMTDSIYQLLWPGTTTDKSQPESGPVPDLPSCQDSEPKLEPVVTDEANSEDDMSHLHTLMQVPMVRWTVEHVCVWFGMIGLSDDDVSLARNAFASSDGPALIALQAAGDVVQLLQRATTASPGADFNDLGNRILAKRDALLHGAEAAKSIGLDPCPPKGKSEAIKRSFHDAVKKLRRSVPADMIDHVYNLLADSLSRVLLRRTLRKGITKVQLAVSMRRNANLGNTDTTPEEGRQTSDIRQPQPPTSSLGVHRPFVRKRNNALLALLDI